MRHHHCHGFGRRFARPDDPADRRHGGPFPGGRRGHGHADHDHGDHPLHRLARRFGGGRGGRPFDYGELRLLALTLIAAQPRHGYELMQAIEDRMGGSYRPSPGVIYPTLAWLEEMGFAALEPAEQGRKRYRITPEGEAFLAANKPAADALLARLGGDAGGAPGRPGGVPAPVLRAMENLKLALRLRLRSGPLDAEAAAAIAAALDEAARTVERS